MFTYFNNTALFSSSSARHKHILHSSLPIIMIYSKVNKTKIPEFKSYFVVWGLSFGIVSLFLRVNHRHMTTLSDHRTTRGFPLSQFSRAFSISLALSGKLFRTRGNSKTLSDFGVFFTQRGEIAREKTIQVWLSGKEWGKLWATNWVA